VDTSATLSPRSDRTFYVWNALVSCAAVAFIAFILLREGPGGSGLDLRFLPPVNAVFNGLSALALTLGFVAIRRKAVHLHRLCMVSAFALSSLFLVGYLSYHFVHGDTRYGGTGALRGLYLFILTTHIVLSITVVPPGADVVLPGLHSRLRPSSPAQPSVPAHLALRLGDRRRHLLVPARVEGVRRRPSRYGLRAEPDSLGRSERGARGGAA
jgi:putative membrane protein